MHSVRRNGFARICCWGILLAGHVLPSVFKPKEALLPSPKLSADREARGKYTLLGAHPLEVPFSVLRD